MNYSEEETLEEFKVLLDHKKDEATLYNKLDKEDNYNQDRYQVLGEKPELDLETETYEFTVNHPSFWEEAAANTVASSITTSLVLAESVLETSYNGMRAVVKILD